MNCWRVAIFAAVLIAFAQPPVVTDLRMSRDGGGWRVWWTFLPGEAEGDFALLDREGREVHGDCSVNSGAGECRLAGCAAFSTGGGHCQVNLAWRYPGGETVALAGWAGTCDWVTFLPATFRQW